MAIYFLCLCRISLVGLFILCWCFAMCFVIKIVCFRQLIFCFSDNQILSLKFLSFVLFFYYLSQQENSSSTGGSEGGGSNPAADYSEGASHVLAVIHQILSHHRTLEHLWHHKKIKLHQRLALTLFQEDVKQVRPIPPQLNKI